MNTSKKKVLAFAAISLCIGCAPTLPERFDYEYPGVYSLPLSETVNLRNEATGVGINAIAIVDSVDGERVILPVSYEESPARGPVSMKLTPGEHRLSVRLGIINVSYQRTGDLVRQHSAAGVSKEKKMISFKAYPGFKYYIKVSCDPTSAMFGGPWNLWIEDVETKKVVAGSKPGTN